MNLNPKANTISVCTRDDDDKKTGSKFLTSYINYVNNKKIGFLIIFFCPKGDT